MCLQMQNCHGSMQGISLRVGSRIFLNSVVSWPQLATKPHAAACSLLFFPSGVKERTGRTKARKLVGWDEETSEGKRGKNKWCKGNHLPPVDRCSASRWAMATSHTNRPPLPSFYCWAWGYIAWSIPLVNWGHLPWLCSLPIHVHPQLTCCEGRVEKRKSLDAVRVLLSNS